MKLRPLFIFAGKFVALLVLFSAIWYWLLPFYAGILVGVGNGTLSSLGYPPMLHLKDREITLTVFAQHVEVSTEIMAFYGVPLLLALVWAAPNLSHTRRRRLSAWGVGGIALLHWLNLLGQAGMLLSPYWLGKLFAERLFLFSALADMLLPTLLCVSLALKPQEAQP
uniref:Uncharacterized protein n=2 Tax=Candidatus Bipolaricaulota TaxID=67810 RepID=H5S9X7_9BACT|nr:hypothetical protein HGMM_F03H09C22 [uncultured Acetothermia bacterium]BAL59231.1 hypothetical protein HGMM_OP3C386 [Candidatus Acetothermum autotrophicum]